MDETSLYVVAAYAARYSQKKKMIDNHVGTEGNKGFVILLKNVDGSNPLIINHNKVKSQVWHDDLLVALF